jgi:hypothetical protein
MSHAQPEMFPSHTAARARAEQQAREWSMPAKDTLPTPRWMAEWGGEAEPGHVPSLPQCSRECPWRKPQRVILAERALAGEGPWPYEDQCVHPDKYVRDIDNDETCWPKLAAIGISAPQGVIR